MLKSNSSLAVVVFATHAMQPSNADCFTQCQLVDSDMLPCVLQCCHRLPNAHLHLIAQHIHCTKYKALFVVASGLTAENLAKRIDHENYLQDDHAKTAVVWLGGMDIFYCCGDEVCFLHYPSLDAHAHIAELETRCMLGHFWATSHPQIYLLYSYIAYKTSIDCWQCK